MTIKINGKTTLTALAAGILPGLQKRFPTASTVLAFGGGVTVAQASSKLQTLIDNRAAAVVAKAAALQAVADENAQMPALIAFLHALEAFLRGNFNADATALADFSLEPPKARTPMTAEAKAIASAKAQATRKARGTVSAKAKKAIKGNVHATLVVTPNAPATATPEPAAPAAAAAAPTKA